MFIMFRSHILATRLTIDVSDLQEITSFFIEYNFWLLVDYQLVGFKMNRARIVHYSAFVSEHTCTFMLVYNVFFYYYTILYVYMYIHVHDTR